MQRARESSFTSDVESSQSREFLLVPAIQSSWQLCRKSGFTSGSCKGRVDFQSYDRLNLSHPCLFRQCTCRNPRYICMHPRLSCINGPPPLRQEVTRHTICLRNVKLEKTGRQGAVQTRSYRYRRHIIRSPPLRLCSTTIRGSMSSNIARFMIAAGRGKKSRSFCRRIMQAKPTKATASRYASTLHEPR